jgi:hypothetical protein
MRKSFSKDAEVFLKRYGNLSQKMRESFSKDAGVFSKRYDGNSGNTCRMRHSIGRHVGVLQEGFD